MANVQEIWRDVPHYEGIYQVSSLGNVKSINRIDCRGQKRSEKLLKYSLIRGYCSIAIQKNRIPERYGVHRLVALAFISNPLNKPQVNHIDGNKLNNRLDNLEWMTPMENIHHAINTGLRISKGEGNPSAKLSEKDIADIFYSKEIQRITAEKYGVHLSTIEHIKARKSWRHITVNL